MLENKNKNNVAVEIGYETLVATDRGPYWSPAPEGMCCWELS